jgi:membrane protein required for colicin V production
MTFAHAFDVGAMGVLGFFLVRGALRGLTGEFMSLFGLIASSAGSWMFAQDLADIALVYYSAMDRTVMELTCASVIFICISLIFAFLANVLRSVVRAAKLSFLDHSLGAAAGALRAFCVVLFIYGIVATFSPVIPSAWMQESAAMKGASVAWPPVFAFLQGKGWIDIDRLSQFPLNPSNLDLDDADFKKLNPDRLKIEDLQPQTRLPRMDSERPASPKPADLSEPMAALASQN